MRFKHSIALSASVLIGALAASPVYAVNCSISYYCYRSMTPGAAPPEPVMRPRTNVPTANGDRLVRRPNAPARVPAPQAGNQPDANPPALSAEQRRAQAQAEQQRLAAQRRAQQQAQQRAQQQRLAAQRAQQQRAAAAQPPRQAPTVVASNAQQAEQQRLAAERRAAEQLLAQRRTARANTPVRNSVPAVAPAIPAATPQSCSTLTLKIRELERQATIYARTREQEKSQRMFKLAADLRKDAEKQTCPAI